MSSSDKPSITPSPDGPYLVRDLENCSNRNGPIAAKPMMALCRCGGSSNKPFCDGTHAKIGFSSAKPDGRLASHTDDYPGVTVTIHDNRRICAHAGACTDGLPTVFREDGKPWIDPDGAALDKIVATVRACPSGALTYSIAGVEQRDWGGAPAIVVSPNGPYVVTGGASLVDATGTDRPATDHYTLCRCGASKNKPFCDGAHWEIKFTDDKN